MKTARSSRWPRTRTLANVGLAMWLVGAAVFLGLDGRAWDIAGAVLGFSGVLIEVTASLWSGSRGGTDGVGGP